MFDSALSLRYKSLMSDDQKPPVEPGDNRGERMQRIRVGLTGLAVVLLLIALATALFNRVGNQVPGNASAIAAAKVEDAKDEPLADLGVAPGAPANEASDGAAIPPK
jgi:hypothetical protein